VWLHFNPFFKDGAKFGRCKLKKTDTDEICGEEIKASGGNTTGMKNHLKIHGITSKSAPKRPLEPSLQPLISIALKRRTLPEIVARAAVVDNISLASIPTSEAVICQARTFGYSLPNHFNTIRKLLMEFYQTAVDEYKDRFAALKEQNVRFSITTDGWTNTLSSSRMLNVSLRCKSQCFKLGLESYSGSIDAFIYADLVKKKLSKFGLDLSRDIISSTQDGESMMRKYGSIIEPESQLCLNHGFHLAVRKSLYSPRKNFDFDLHDAADNEPLADDFEDENDNPSEEDLRDYGQIFESSSQFSIETESSESSEQLSLIDCLQDTLKNARKLSKYFRDSSVRNDRLQTFVQEGVGHRLKCLLDVETRWNSILKMCKRLVKLKKYILKFFDEYDISVSYASEDFFHNLQIIVNCLEPLEEAILMLSKHDSNLLAADGVIKFALSKLNDIDLGLSRCLVEAIRSNVIPRRSKKLVSLLKVLHHCSFEVLNESEPLEYSSKEDVIQLAEQLFSRLFQDSPVYEPVDKLTEDELFDVAFNEIENDSAQDEVSPVCPVTQPTDLKSFINAELQPVKSKQRKSDMKSEFELSIINGQLTSNLQSLHGALMAVDPTSTASEQSFSVASQCVTKVRNKMGDDLLDVLVFLKYYFKSKDSETMNKKQKV